MQMKDKTSQTFNYNLFEGLAIANLTFEFTTYLKD
jgi:hypothetical protein